MEDQEFYKWLQAQPFDFLQEMRKLYDMEVKYQKIIRAEPVDYFRPNHTVVPLQDGINKAVKPYQYLDPTWKTEKPKHKTKITANELANFHKYISENL